MPTSIHKLLIVSTPFYPGVGGIEFLAESFARYFTRAGLSVTVVTRQSSSAADSFPFRVIRQPGLAELWRAYADSDAQLLFGDGLRLGWPLLLGNGRAVISHQNWQPSREAALPRCLRRWLRRKTLNVCASEALAGRLDTPACVIGNPYEDSVFFRDESVSRSRDIIFVGRLVPEKGPLLLLKALALLASQGGQPLVTVVGAGSELPRLKAFAADNGLADRIVFTGAKESREVAALLRQHRILVVPSEWEEPFGIVALEGLACGAAVLVSKRGGLPEAVGPVGILFEPGSTESLAAGLSKLLTPDAEYPDPRLVSEHLSGFKLGLIAERYLQLIIQQASR